MLDETLTRWITTGRAERGLAFVEALLASARYKVVFVDRGLFDSARERAAAFAEHRLSFTDGASAVIAARMRLDGIFAFDDGFRRIGFNLLPS